MTDRIMTLENITDPDFIWEALDDVHDAETTLADYAAAVSRAQRAALAASQPAPDCPQPDLVKAEAAPTDGLSMGSSAFRPAEFTHPDARLEMQDFLTFHPKCSPVVNTGQAMLEIAYTNWRGETSVRRITPRCIWWGSTEYHEEPQWMLTAYDEDKRAERDFAMKDFGQRVQGYAELSETKAGGLALAAPSADSASDARSVLWEIILWAGRIDWQSDKPDWLERARHVFSHAPTAGEPDEAPADALAASQSAPDCHQPDLATADCSQPAQPVAVEDAATQAVQRAIDRLRSLHPSAGRPAWDEIVAEEMAGALRALTVQDAARVPEIAVLIEKSEALRDDVTGRVDAFGDRIGIAQPMIGFGAKQWADFIAALRAIAEGRA